MSYGFQNRLVAEKIDEAESNGRAEWRLAQDLVYVSESIGNVIIPRGFTTDMASVPRLPLAYWLAGDTAHASAVVHDYLVRTWYPLRRIGWGGAADVFDEAMRHEGVPGWRRWLMVRAVKAANPSNRFEVGT